ncbi:MAG: mechanosensitive ion channel protein MscS [Bacteroidetes bacterium HGW-Bacteroidetes-1]|jgi:small conductance mechanosensitive channel|nr:MAG: mechanosensitive ion channel protein MscS [Bacteroidetes bacterium HGW-Bacteroidetes-1]
MNDKLEKIPGEISLITDYLAQMIVSYGLKLMGAIIALIIGFWIVGRIKSALVKLMIKRDVEPSLRTFLKSFLSIALKILVIITVLGMVGVQMTSFIAMLGAAGLAVGLALQGTLQNVAGGVIILLFKPFKVGDFIEAQGYMGKVNEIQIFNTLLTTIDNKVVIIPNGGLATGSLTNFSMMSTRRVDWTFGIAYGDKYEKAESVIQKLIDAEERILKEPEPFIALSKLNNSSVDIVVRCWVESIDYWPVFFNMNKNIYNAFSADGISIPFPQMDVHLYESKK